MGGMFYICIVRPLNVHDHKYDNFYSFVDCSKRHADFSKSHFIGMACRRARRSQEWTRACYGLIACSHGWFFRFPRPHTYQEVCMNAYIMTLIQGKKFRTRKHSSEHIRRHHRQHRSDTRPRSQREHGSTWAENGGNNHQQRDELQKMAPVPAPSSQRSPVSGLRRAAKGGENAWGATVARGEAG